MRARVELSSPRLEHPATWDLRVALVNDGDEPVEVSVLPGQVAFEVVDNGGARVPLGPPPVPLADAEASALSPGESLALAYHGDELFPDAPPPGSYRLRFAAGEITSPWVEFDVSR